MIATVRCWRNLAIVGGKWKTDHSLASWRGRCPGITRKMLTQHLRELERDGVVV